MPVALVPPVNQNSKEFDIYMEKLKVRLSTNKYLKSVPLNTREDIAAAYICLDAEANRQIKSAATTIFVGTGVMQNGKLDAIIVLITQISLIWRIALYLQPTTIKSAILNLTFHPVFGLAGGIGSKLCSMNAISASQLSKHR
ncbi:MAG: hypothetical protein IPL02_07530 [Moraxellaceae bacterium]|nr:hypothetical protein [Moraxellaceae bacterium]